MVTKAELRRRIDEIVLNLVNNHGFNVSYKYYDYDGQKPEMRVVSTRMVQCKLNQLRDKLDFYDWTN